MADIKKETGEAQESSKNKKMQLIVAGVLVLLIIVVFVWKQVQIKNIRNDFRAQTEQAQLKIDEYALDRAQYYNRMISQTFSWALRSEMLRENYDQINQYMIQLVKEAGYKKGILVDINGKVILSTDKKIEGQMFGDVFSAHLIQNNEPLVQKYQEGDNIVSTPIFGLNNRLGTFLLIFTPDLNAPDIIHQNESEK